MGEQFKKKVAQGFQVLGDRALGARLKPHLFSNKPEVLRTDHTFVAIATPPPCGTSLTFELIEGGVRALDGVIEVGRSAHTDLSTTLAEIGGVAAGEVTESSSFGGFVAQLREETEG